MCVCVGVCGGCGCGCGDDCASCYDAQDPVKAKLRERVIESRKAVHKETSAQVDKRKDFEAAVSLSLCV